MTPGEMAGRVEQAAEAMFLSDKDSAVAMTRGKTNILKWRRLQNVPETDIPWSLARWGNGCGTQIGLRVADGYRRRARAALRALQDAAPDGAA